MNTICILRVSEMCINIYTYRPQLVMEGGGGGGGSGVCGQVRGVTFTLKLIGKTYYGTI